MVTEDRKSILCDQTNQFDLSSDRKRREKFDGVRATSLRSRFFSSKGAFFSRLRILRMTSVARWSSLRMSAKISFTSPMSGFGAFKISCAVSVLVKIAPSGWFIS